MSIYQSKQAVVTNGKTNKSMHKSTTKVNFCTTVNVWPWVNAQLVIMTTFHMLFQLVLRFDFSRWFRQKIFIPTMSVMRDYGLYLKFKGF